MEIEKVVRVKRFMNCWHKSRVNLLYSGNWLKGEIKDFLSDYEVTQQQFNVLRILRGSRPQPLTTADIRSRLLDRMSDTSRIVDRLCKKGYVAKTRNEQDRRLVDVSITEVGLDLLQRIDYNIDAFDSIMQNLSEDEAEQLSHLLDKLRGNRE